MSAAKALLSASGALKKSTSASCILKKSAATERATSSGVLKKSTATERATSSSLLPLTGLPVSTSKQQASASDDGFLLGDDDLEKIVALLLWMAQDFQPIIHMDDIHYAALETILTLPVDHAIGTLHTASVAKLAKLIDIMMLHKDGSPKDPNATLTFMRRVAKVREQVRATSSDNATERVELNEDEVSLCYQRFGRILLTEDLLPHQKKDKRYRLRNSFVGDTQLTTFHRSFTDNMLRKFLGDKKVALLIWQQGLPGIADSPVAYRRRRHATEQPDMGMLQSGLAECLQWYCRLANNIVVHQTQEGFDTLVSASSLDKQERRQQQTRRRALQKARDALRLGATLVTQRDANKRSYDEMTNTEQKTLEDYETGRAKRAKQALATPKMKPFRRNL